MADHVTGFQTSKGIKKYDYWSLANLPSSVFGPSTARVVDVILPAGAWAGTKSPYSQTVVIEGITPYSQVDLTPSVEQLVIFHQKDLAFVTENDNGVVTVYAIGDKPTSDYTIQATITEVTV